MIGIDLSGKNALITGGTRGIGRAISLTLAQAGARIAAIYRNDTQAAEHTLADLRVLPGNLDHFVLQADIADEAQAVAAVRQAEERFGGALDFLILDAAAGAHGPLAGMTTEDWKRLSRSMCWALSIWSGRLALCCGPAAASSSSPPAPDMTPSKGCRPMAPARRRSTRWRPCWRRRWDHKACASTWSVPATRIKAVTIRTPIRKA